MNIKHNNVCIVGAGSAGWIVASTLIRYFPKKNITLIESPKIPHINVGESTTSMMKMFINGHLGIDDKDFLPGTDGILKMSVKFNDFYKLGDGGYHYPFGNPVFKFKGSRYETWSIKKHYYPETPVQNFARTFVPQVTLAEMNKYSDNLNNQFDDFHPNIDYGYHFSANKLGQYLRDNYAKPRGVKHIVSEIRNVNVNEDGVESLVLDDGTVVSYDFYIDCSGFKSLLLGQALKEPYVDFKHWLPNDSAWATPTEYKDVYKEMRPYTNCTALENGWAWHTPIWSRVGNGYSYSSQHVSDEDALDQFKKYLTSKKVPVPLKRDEVENLPFFNVKSKPGYYERNWVKNVFAIGLAGGFLEPLEGTGLLFVTNPILELCKHMSRERFTNFNIDMMNMFMKYQYMGWRDFLTFFYMMSIRDDSQYWKDINAKNYFVDYLTEESKWMGNYQEFFSAFQQDETSHKLPNNSGIVYVSKGMNSSFDLDDTVIDRLRHLEGTDFSDVAEQIKVAQDHDVERWQIAARKELHAYDYLKKYIYEKDNK